MLYENVFFDLYGTLVDIRTDETMDFVWRMTTDIYRQNGAVYTPQELKKAFYRSINDRLQGKDEDYELDVLNAFRDLYLQKGVFIRTEFLRRTADEFRKASTLSLNLYNGVLDGLLKLKQAGKRLYLLLNGQACFTMGELERLNLIRFFDDIFISSDYGVKKPSGKFFQIPFDKYGIDKEKSILVGNDGFCDIFGAKCFGIDTMYVKTENSLEEDLPDATYIFSKHNFKQMVDILLI